MSYALTRIRRVNAAGFVWFSAGSIKHPSDEQGFFVFMLKRGSRPPKSQDLRVFLFSLPYFFGVHSRTCCCASAVWAGVILGVTSFRNCIAIFTPCAAARLSHLYAAT